MKYIKKYNEGIDFNDKVYKSLIVCIPSGEVFECSYDNIDKLYLFGLIKYVAKPGTVGFYVFEEKNIEKVLDIIQPNRYSKPKNILIKDNKFKKDTVNKLIDLLEQYPFDVELTIEDYSMVISYQNIHLDIIYNDESSPMFLVIKKMNGEFMTKYTVPNDELFIRSIVRLLK